jgi:L,D-peptidoglycan transpeptidase YkuD (ErfK/YbiS/YcfS/YnhG family)
VVLGHNDDPPVPGLGSAIFLHLVRSARTPTRGCVAVDEASLRTILAVADCKSQLCIEGD